MKVHVGMNNIKAQKIKVIYIISSLSTGGAQMMLYRLLTKLDRAIFEPQVMVLLEGYSPIRRNIESIEIPVQIIGFSSKANPIPLYKMYKLIKSKKPDIVHTQLFAADILGRIICRLLRIPVIITSIRNSYYGGKFRDLMIKLTENLSTETTIVSKVAAKRFIDHNIIPASKLKVIYNGLDTDLYFKNLSLHKKVKLRALFGIDLNGFIILAAGRLTEQKGYMYLLKAFSLIVDKDYKVNLVFAGTGKEESRLKAETERLGLKEKVTFLGRVDEIVNLMAAADLFVSSSLWEGLPGVVMEAMASGLPVVATDVGGTQELVENGISGYLVQPGATDALASAMERVILLPNEKRKTMGNTGRRIIEECFKVDDMVKAYVGLYMNCLNEKSQI